MKSRRQFMKQSSLIGLTVGLGAVSASCTTQSTSQAHAGTLTSTALRYNADGKFKIVQFTDIHWQKDGPDDKKTASLMAEILDAEKPDLVVLTGDTIEGSKMTAEDDYTKAFFECTQPIVQRKIPWAAVFGNHDEEGPMNRQDMMKLMQKIPYCLARSGPKDIDGVSNYVLSIYDAKGKEARNTLYFIDSLAYAPKEIDGYAWISRKQINWYIQTSQNIEKQNHKKLPALAFFHIPLQEYNQVFGDKSLGCKQEDVCCSKINSGFFAAMLEARDIIGTFVGHDHVNDYEGTLFGIRLCYGRATGFSTYGKEGFPRGARVIVLTENQNDFQSWLRVENNQIIKYQPTATATS